MPEAKYMELNDVLQRLQFSIITLYNIQFYITKFQYLSVKLHRYYETWYSKSWWIYCRYDCWIL